MFEAEAKKVSRALIVVVVGMSIFAGVSVAGVTIYQWSTGGFDRDVEGAAKIAPQEFKGPMLEQDEGEVLARVRAAENKLLHEVAWVDRSQGLARVPIEVAMQIYAARASTSTVSGGGTP